MPARAARAPRAPRAPVIAPAAATAVAEPTTSTFTPDDATCAVAPTPEPAASVPAAPEPAAKEPSGYKGLKVWQRAMDLTIAVHALTRTFPAPDQDGLGADLRRSAAQVPSYVAAGNSLFQRAEYIQYLSAAHGALARLETLLLVAERLGHVEPGDSAPLLSQASQVGYLLRALTRALQPPSDGSAPARGAGRRPAPAPAAD